MEIIWGCSVPLCPAQALGTQTLSQAPWCSAKGTWPDVTPWPGPQDRDSPTPASITCGMLLPQSHLYDPFTAFVPRYSYMDQMLKSPPKASNVCSFYKSLLHRFRNHTAAPCSPLKDPGPWPRFSPSFFFFYISVLISPWLEEATHLLKAFSELRMKSET